MAKNQTKRSRYFLRVFSLLLFLGAVLFLVWMLFHEEVQPVRIAELRVEDLRSTINTNGRIEPDHIFELRAPLSGLCRRILVHEGSLLQKNQPILEMDGELQRSELAAARAELAAAEVDLRDIQRSSTKEEQDQAEAEVSRARLEVDHLQKTFEKSQWLLQRNAISAQEVENGRQELVLAHQNLEAAVARRDNRKARFGGIDQAKGEKRLEAVRVRIRYLEDLIARLTIRAPIEGTLYHFDVKDGAYLNAGELIGTMADLGQLRLKALVDEPDLGKVRVDAEARVTWNALVGRTWNAKVEYIPSNVVTLGTRSVAEVLCRFQGSTQGLLSDLHVNVEIVTTDKAEAPALPREAVIIDGKKQYVWVPRDGKAQRVSVETGRTTSSKIEIVGGISLGERVILPTEATIAEGMKVQISP